MALNISEEAEWYFLDKTENDKVRGPISERDLDVMMRTGSMDKMNFVWKKGMPNWTQLTNVEDLRKKLLDNADILPNMDPAINSLLKKRRRSGSETGEQDDQTKMEENKVDDDDDEDVEEELKALLVQSLANEDEQLAGALKGSGKEKNSARKKRSEPDLTGLTEDQIKKLEKNRKKTKKAAEKKKKVWYEPKINTNVYVQGIPSDLARQDIVDLFSKCGVIRPDRKTGEARIKIYTDDQGNPKGDALISFAKEESVAMAVELLHEREIKPGYKLNVEKAVFQQKGDYKPREKSHIDRIQEIKNRAKAEKLFSWNDEEEKGEGLKIVIMKHMFNLEEEHDENYFEDIKNDILEECERLGSVHRIQLFETNPEGVVEVKFKDSAAAEECIKLMNGRFFDGKEVECFYWDGVTNFKRARLNEEEEQKRIDEFGKWLEDQA